MKEHNMNLERFNELELQGKKALCPRCKEEFVISHDRTTGGGYGTIPIIGLECPRCTTKFGVGMEDLK